MGLSLGGMGTPLHSCCERYDKEPPALAASDLLLVLGDRQPSTGLALLRSSTASRQVVSPPVTGVAAFLGVVGGFHQMNLPETQDYLYHSWK